MALSDIDVATLQRRIDDLERRHHELTPRQAERELVEILSPLFEADGYRFEYTGGPADGGFDYTARKEATEDTSALTTVIEYKH